MCNATTVQLLQNYSNAVKQEKRAARARNVAAWQSAAKAGIAAQQALYMHYQQHPEVYTEQVIAMEKQAIAGKL